jgi:anti-sigma regulatory factor (Ser/Thr protein kinase)
MTPGTCQRTGLPRTGWVGAERVDRRPRGQWLSHRRGAKRSRRHHLSLPCDPSAPGLARHALKGEDIGPVSEDATLVASELVTNAVLHSGCGPDDRINLDARWSRGCLRITVHDPGASNTTPEVLRDGHRSSGVLGLRVVQQIALRWGTEQPDGRYVWAELTPRSSSSDPN